MLTIENDHIRVSVLPRGAELCSLRLLKEDMEFIWQADPAFWGKHSPVLFPIVGTLRNDGYYYKGQYYKLPRHGFARDRFFSTELQSRQELLFLLNNDESTEAIFPFPFEFRIRYALSDNRLSVSYLVSNSGSDDLLFSVGGHPAFRIPLSGNSSYEDYFIEFEKAENAPRWPISSEGLIEKSALSFFLGSRRLPLSKDLFKNDALVFKDLRSSSLRVGSDRTEHGFQFEFSGFPYLGIWAAKGADFVCIEPWCGIADSVDSTQKLEEKEGIFRLAPGSVFSREWSVTVY